MLKQSAAADVFISDLADDSQVVKMTQSIDFKYENYYIIFGQGSMTIPKSKLEGMLVDGQTPVDLLNEMMENQ